MKRKKIFLVLLLLVFSNSILYLFYKFEKRKVEWIALKKVIESEISQFKGEAGIVIKDLKLDWEISFNKNKLFPSASLVKVPIMLACFYAIKEGKIKLEDTLRLKPSYKVPGSGILKDMPAGSEFSIEKLIEFMISDSDNTATNMLIDVWGFDYLNSYFIQLGLKNTNVTRKMLDFRYRRQGIENYTDAKDMAYLLENIYKRALLGSRVSKKCLSLLKQQKINDRIPAKLPFGTMVAHKTGLEYRVCHDAGIVFTSKGNFLICVLTKHRGNITQAKEFISQIAQEVYNYYQGF